MIKSAGFVLVRKVNGKYKFLLLRCYNLWDFPKGKQDENETLIETAYRETFEEAGINKEDMILNWGYISHTTEPYSKPKKTATYFMAETNKEQVVISPNPITKKYEHQEYRWVSYEEAVELCNERITKVLNWVKDVLDV